MDKQELDRQYSPSQWSRRYKISEEVISNHVEIVTRGSNDAKLRVPYESDVRYGDGPRQLLDVFGSTSISEDSDIFVFIHGGFWQELNKDVSSYFVAPLYDVGVRVVIVGYDLAPTASLSRIVEEIEEAASYVLDLACKLGSRSVTFGGHSAGAHLAAMLFSGRWFDCLNATQKSKVHGFVLMSGVYDLLPVSGSYVNDAVKMTRQEAKELSPMFKNFTIHNPHLKIIVVIAEYESPEFHRQSARFKEKLSQNGIEAEYLMVEGVDHFDLVENLQKEDYILTKEIIKLVTLKQK